MTHRKTISLKRTIAGRTIVVDVPARFNDEIQDLTATAEDVRSGELAIAAELAA